MPINITKIIQEKNSYHGLSAAEVKERQSEYGFNRQELEDQQKCWKRFLVIFSEPMILLLLATAITYFFIGDRVEAIIMLATLVPIVVMEFYQSTKTDNAIKALSKMVNQISNVYRDGVMVKIDTAEIVPGDLVYLTAGDRIPVDGFILNSPGFSIDESMLTGESVSVTKEQVLPSAEKLTKLNKVFQGSLVVQGEGHIVAELTGRNTTYGKLGKMLVDIVGMKTPLQEKVERLVRLVAIVAIFVAIVVGVMLYFKSGLAGGVIGALTIAISIIPEEFPIVFSVFLIMGVLRMSKQNALIRQMVMVETLGSATVICTDKTGTLTEGKMSLNQIYTSGKIYSVTTKAEANEPIRKLIGDALLALEQIAIDPIEIEVQDFARQIDLNVDKIFRDRVLVNDTTFNSTTKVVSHLWQHENKFVQYTAGSPESILKYCTMAKTQKEEALSVLTTMSNSGLRVIGVATRVCSTSDKFSLEDMEFSGFIAMSDPPKEGVLEAIDICQKAGIKIVMITGDNKLTAHSIATQIGLNHNDQMLSGEELGSMSKSELREAVAEFNIFTRVQPEQKLLIVEALQSNGEVVAMTGDGVNDSLALKKANIGIAMGLRGTEVARTAAGIVLLDDNFATIAKAIKEGRRIYDNLRQAFVFLFSFHIPIIGLGLIPLFFGHPLVFAPIHVVFLELICDPASVLGFNKEKARKGLMLEKPRSVEEPLIDQKKWFKIVIQGVSILAVSFSFYWYYSIYLGQIELGRTISFLSLVLSQAFLIMFAREWAQIRSNFLLMSISIITIVAIFLIVFVPGLRIVFHLVPLQLSQIVYAVVGAILVAIVARIVLWFENR